MKLHISHRSVYHYPERVHHSTQCLRLTPQSSRRQRVLSWQLGLPARASMGLLTQPVSCIGLPVVAVPLWPAGQTMPLAVQVIAPAWREDLALRGFLDLAVRVELAAVQVTRDQVRAAARACVQLLDDRARVVLENPRSAAHAGPAAAGGLLVANAGRCARPDRP